MEHNTIWTGRNSLPYREGRDRKGQEGAGIRAARASLPWRRDSKGQDRKGLVYGYFIARLPYHGGGAAYREGGIEEGQEGQQLHLQGGPGVGQGQPAR